MITTYEYNYEKELWILLELNDTSCANDAVKWIEQGIFPITVSEEQSGFLESLKVSASHKYTWSILSSGISNQQSEELGLRALVANSDLFSFSVSAFCSM